MHTCVSITSNSRCEQLVMYVISNIDRCWVCRILWVARLLQLFCWHVRKAQLLLQSIRNAVELDHEDTEPLRDIAHHHWRLIWLFAIMIWDQHISKSSSWCHCKDTAKETRPLRHSRVWPTIKRGRSLRMDDHGMILWTYCARSST